MVQEPIEAGATDPQEVGGRALVARGVLHGGPGRCTLDLVQAGGEGKDAGTGLQWPDLTQGQVVDGDAPVAQEHGALHRIAEFPHVPGPGVGTEATSDDRLQRWLRQVVSPSRGGDEVPGQEKDVVTLSRSGGRWMGTTLSR